MRKRSWIGIGVLLLVLVAPLVFGTTGATSFTMNWVIFTNKSFAVSYGGTCTNSQIYFNEIDANFDPDIDGNAAKVPPAGRSRVSDLPTTKDYNFVGVVNPSDHNIAFSILDFSNPPSAYSGFIDTELASIGYTGIANADGTAAVINYTGTLYTAYRAVYKVTESISKIASLRLRFKGAAINGGGCDTNNSGTNQDANFYAWDYNNSVYRNIGNYQGDRSQITSVNIIDANIALDYNVTRWIGSDTNMSFLVVGPYGSPTESCLIADFMSLTVGYYSDENESCQSATIAPMTIYNNGNADVNVDGNFDSSITSTDLNVVLKVWQGTGSGCGTGGFGGWEQDCSVTQEQTAPSTTTCRQYNRFNAANSGRLITQLSPGSATQLCMSGDLNAYVSQGTHTKIFQTRDYNT